MAKKLSDSIVLEIKDSGICTKEFAVKVDAEAAKSEQNKAAPESHPSRNQRKD